MADNLTIDDIAEALGVSKTTVSRAISGKGRISQATTERILTYINEHNYKPNVYAQGLAMQKTSNIGVVWPGDSDAGELPFFQKCLLGINRAAAQSHYDLLVSILEGSDISGIRRIVENRKADGMILTRTLMEDLPAQYLKESGIPFVAIGSSLDPDVICVDNANEKACCDLTERMLQSGVTRLALIGGPCDHVISGTRLRGFEKGHAKSGIKPDEKLIHMGVWDMADVETAFLDVLEDGADALICMDDGIAEKVLTICHSRGIQIPKTIRLASFYDSSVLENVFPSVTAIRFDDAALGEAAADTLIRLLAGEEVHSRALDNYRMIFRETFY